MLNAVGSAASPNRPEIATVSGASKRDAPPRYICAAQVQRIYIMFAQTYTGSRGLAAMLFSALPLEEFLQCLSVRMIGRLRALQKTAATLFAKVFVPHFFVLVTRSERCEGSVGLSSSFASASEDTPMTSEALIVPVDVPIDLVEAGGLEKLLRSALPGPGP